ncbi:MAG: transposase, partial [Candidatus Portnoybacteria bacterium]|nr:transposase [Candidatus Portnoybacteria bacterium]
MSIERPQLVNDEIYHVTIRGTADMEIFKNQSDYYRMVFSIYEFNNAKPVRIRDKRGLRNRNVRGQTSDISGFNERDLLVEVLAFCFMPNHIHLLLKQIKDNGITKFMRKVGTGYAGYFNNKYKKRGHLFQGKFWATRVKTDGQLQTAFVYIHSNPISLVEPKWKEREIKDTEKTIKFLENYKWSSYLDY